MTNDRYSTPTMDEVWDDEYRYSLMLRVWSAVALVQSRMYDQGEFDLPLVTTANALDELDQEWQDNGLDVLVSRVREMERECGHEVEAMRRIAQEGVRSFVDISPLPDLVHLDMTSSDVVDLVDSIRIADSIKELLFSITHVVKSLLRKVKQSKECLAVGYTHMQPAEIITHGYRLAGHLMEFHELRQELMSFTLNSKSVRGAVGNAQVQNRFIRSGASGFESELLKEIADRLFLSKSSLHLSPHSTQTSPRHNEYALVSLVDRMAAAISRLAITARFLFSKGDWSVNDGKVGSSAMPHKVNPASWEQLSSLSQTVHALCAGMWSTTANQIDMRTLDDSAQRRVSFEDIFGCMDYSLQKLSDCVDVLGIESNEDIVNDSRMYSSVILSYAVRVYGDRTKEHRAIADLVRNNPTVDGLRDALNEWHGFREYIDDILDISGFVEPCVASCNRVIARIEDKL